MHLRRLERHVIGPGPEAPAALQLYLSGRRGGQFLTALAQRVGDGDQLSGNGGDDDFVKPACFTEAICEGSQAWVVMWRDQRRLEH